jgi:peptide chain release factor 2
LLTSKVESFNKLFNDLEECEILLDMALDESDTDTIEEVSLQIKAIDKEISKLSLELMLDEFHSS